MINRLKPKSEFSRNVLTLMTGTTIAQAIPIAISPILTRIYTPDDFGVFTLFMSFSMIFGSIVNGRYDMAIMLPKRDNHAFNILIFGLLISFIISIILFIIIYVNNTLISELLNSQEISYWLYFSPIVIFFISLFSLLNTYNNRIKAYKVMKNALIYKSIILAVIQLSIGLSKNGPLGLILGSIISSIISTYTLIKNIKIKNIKINIPIIIYNIKKYKQFPFFSTWSILATNLNIHALNFFISSFFNATTLGFYSLVQRIMAMPFILIGNSFGQIFFQKASEEYKKTNQCINAFKNIFFKLFIVAIPIFSLLYISIIDIFSFAFGKEWEISGYYAQAMLPFFFMRFIIVPLTYVTIIMKKENISLIIQVSFLILTIISFITMHQLNFNILDMLHIYSIIASIYYLLFLFILYKLSIGLKL